MPRGGLAEIFILLKLGDQRYKSKVSIKDFLQVSEVNKVLDVSFFGAAALDGTILDILLDK